MTIRECQHESVSPKDTRACSFEVTDPHYSLSTTHNYAPLDQQSVYGKLASYNFPRATTTTSADSAPSLTHTDSGVTSPGQHLTPRNSTITTSSPVYDFGGASGPPPPRRGALHRRSTVALSLSSNESIFTTHLRNDSVDISTTTTSPGSKSIDFASNLSPVVLQFPGSSSTSPIAAHPRLQPPLKSYKSTPVPQEKRNSIGARRRHTHIPLPLIDLDVAAQPLTPRKLSTGDGVDVMSISSGSIEKLPVFVSEDAEEENESDEDKRSVGIIDFLRESISPRAMSVSEAYDPSNCVRAPLMDVGGVISGAH